MYSPEQPPAGEQPSEEQTAETPSLERVQGVVPSAPLYEFPPSIPAPWPAQSGTQGEEGQPDYEAVRRGLIYPPPPAFYQHSTQEQGGSTNAAPSPDLPYSPPLPWHYRPETSHAPSAPITPVPPQTAPSAPAKKSRRWIWIVASILGVAVLASCGLCGWASYTLFSSSFQQIAGSLQVVNDYYSAVQSQNYTQAYSYLAPSGAHSGLALDQYIQQARSQDEEYGPVSSYTPAQPSFTTSSSGNPDLSRFTVVVDVNREKLKYNALLTLSKVDGKWKIIDFDRI